MAHTFDTSVANPTTLTATATTNPLATNYTCGVGTTVLVLLLATGATSTARTGGDPTFNGVAMTQADTSRGVTETSVEVWYMINPPTGTQYSLSIPNSGGKAMKAVIASAKAGTGYTSEYQHVGYTATTGASPNCTVNTTAGGIVFAVAASGDQSFAPTARTGTNLYQGDVGAWGYATQYYLESTTSTPRTISFTDTTSDDYGMIAVSFKEVPTPPNAPTLVSPASGSTVSDTTPSFRFIGTDNNLDRLEYQIEICLYGSGEFSALGQVSRYWRGISVNSSNKDVYAGLYGGEIYKQTAGSGDFVALELSSMYLSGISVNSYNGDVYASCPIVGSAGIYKQTAGSGAFVAVEQAEVAWFDVSVNSSNADVYACVSGGDIYKQTAGSGTFNALGQTARSWYGISVNSSNGDVYACVQNGDIYEDRIVIVNANSFVEDSDFENITTPANTHPFNSGDTIQYTIPSGSELTSGSTYYWRVKAIDP